MKVIQNKSYDNSLFLSIKEQVCLSRGMKYADVKTYLNNEIDCTYPPTLLGVDKLREAAKKIMTAVSLDQPAFVIVDSDCDGFTSAALLINYLYCAFPSWVSRRLTYGFHKGKAHGIDEFVDELDNSNIKLLLVPDAGSNDNDSINRLHSKMDIIILDHHIIEGGSSNTNATIINSQYSYPNPELSGVGVVYKFCQFMDKLLETSYAEEFKDLVAIGLTGDMQSMLSLETKQLIFEGLKLSNLRNPFIRGMAEKNDYSLQKSDYKPSGNYGLKISPIGSAFFIIPFINAMCRSGTQEEKELIFKSMLNHCADEFIPSNKRGHKEGEEETLLSQALRCCTNVKNRQTRAEEAGMAHLQKQIESKLEDKVFVFYDDIDCIQKEIYGLVCNKLASAYQRPVCIVSKCADGTYAGSMRGYTKTGIQSFKIIAESSNACEWCRGHDNAAGICINDPEQFIKDMNETLKDISSDVVYYVDYVFSGGDIDSQIVYELAEMIEFIGTDFERPQIHVKGLKVNSNNIRVMANGVIKISTPTVDIIKFGTTEEQIEELQSGITINLVGTCNLNEWNFEINPQVTMIAYEKAKEWNF